MRHYLFRRWTGPAPRKHPCFFIELGLDKKHYIRSWSESESRMEKERQRTRTEIDPRKDSYTKFIFQCRILRRIF